MIQRNAATIDPKKAKAFSSFIKENAKTNEYWKQVCKEASTSINKKELDALFDKIK